MTAFVTLAITAALVFCGTADAQTSTVSTYDLGTLGGGHSAASDINERGEVVGTAATASGENHAFLWTPASGMRDLGTLGGDFSAAAAINDFGQVVGCSVLAPGDDTCHAFLWTEDAGMVDLGEGIPSRINNRGQIVGVDADGAVMWTESGQTIRLVGTVGPFSTADGVNDFSSVVGSLWNDGFLTTVVGNVPGAVTTLPAGTAPLDINNLGVVTGFLRYGGPRPFTWSARAGLMNLTPLGGFYGEGLAINDLGHVTGWSERSQPGIRAVLWRNNANPIDLGTLGGRDWHQAMPGGLNNRGQIAGGSNTASGGWHATLWDVALTPSEQVQWIAALIRKVYALEGIRPAHYRSLQRVLTRARESADTGDAAAARRALNTFRRRFDSLARQGDIPGVFVDLVRDASSPR